jgi:hypothetical protein
MGIFSRAQAEGAARGDAIRPFRFSAPEEALVDLHRSIAATRWPDRETVTDECRKVAIWVRLSRM